MRPLKLVVVLGSLGIVAVAVAGIVLWLLTTESGARMVVDRLVAATGAVLTAESVSGTLRDGLTFEKLRFEIERVEATAARADATFELAELVHGRVVIRDLFITPVDVVPRAADASASAGGAPLAAPDLPVTVEFASVAVAGVNLLVGGETRTFGQLTMTVSYIDRTVAVSRFDTEYGPYSFSTQARFDLAAGPSVDATVSLSGRYADRDVLLGGRLVGELPRIDIEAELLEPFRAEARGPVTLNAGPAFDLALAWEAPDPALIAALGLAGIEPGAGSGRIAGDPMAVDIETSTAVGVDAGRYDIDAEARYTQDAVELIGLRLMRDGASMSVTGGIALDTLDYTLAVTGSGIDPGWAVPGWDGRIDVSANASGSLGGAWFVAADDIMIGGVVREQPFSVRGAGRYAADGALSLSDTELRAGSNSVVATGRLGRDVSLNVDVSLVALGELVDSAAGALTGTIAVTGSLDDPVLAGDVDLAGIELGNLTIASARAGGRVGLRGDSPVDLTVTMGGVAVGGTAAVDAAVSVTGTASDHVATVSVTGEDWNGGGRVAGQLTGLAAWRGTIADLAYAQAPFGEWRLRQAAALAATTTRVQLEPVCLGQGDAEICLGIDYGEGTNGRLQVSATDFDLGMLRPFLPEGITAVGRYQVDIDVTGPRENPLGRFRIEGGATEISYARTPTEIITAELQRVTADARIELDRFESSAEVLGTGSDGLRLMLSGRRRDDDSVALDGRIDASWMDIAPLTILSRHVGAVSGRVDAAVGIGGTLDAPQFDGRATLGDGRLELPEWGVTAAAIDGSATSPAGETISFEATGMIDGSQLSLTGTTGLTAGWPTSLRLTGERVPIVQLADTDIVVSPVLAIDVDLPRVDVAGTVEVPEALIAVSELPEQAVRPSSDSIVHGIEDVERTSPLLLEADIDLKLGDDVRYEGSGLLADLGGSLRLRYTSRTSTDASGTLTVTGSYEAFGQELVLDRGELVFTGPLENPNLNVRAIRQIDEITVGINLTGSLEAPVSRIFSEPAMAEADAVSYLLFGRPLAVPDGAGDPDQLRNAAVSLGLRQAVPVIQRIGDSLGLDEFAIESTNVDAGELMAGKRLSPKLFVRYSYGLFNRIGGLLLQYQLNERISIETRSGDQKSMDILYTIERD